MAPGEAAFPPGEAAFQSSDSSTKSFDGILASHADEWASAERHSVMKLAVKKSIGSP